MKKILFLFIVTLLLQSCDDGDVIVTSFNFDDVDLENCGSVSNYVFYKVNQDAQESLSLRLGTPDSIYSNSGTRIFTLNGTSNFVNYRTYDGALGSDYFCSSIPPTSPIVTIDYRAASGTAEFIVTFEYDDIDGVPADIEFNGDTDGDGLPNLYDLDDDGDNVPTSRELDTADEDGDGDPFTNPLDTDGDLIPDYLDTDDDGDGILTRDEDQNGNLDPTDDVTDTTVGPDYLNNAVSNNYDINEYRVHKYKIFKSVKITLKNLVLENGEEELIIETINFGNIEDVETKDKTIKPDFE